MGITTTRFGTVIDALVAALGAAVTDPVMIWDGPQVTTQTDGSYTFGTMASQGIYVGFDGDWSKIGTTDSPFGQTGGGSEAVTVEQILKYLMGPTNVSAEENMQIRCCAIANSGDPDTQTIRNSCIAMVNQVEELLRGDPTLGIDGSTIASLSVGNFFYAFATDDLMIFARLEFTVDVKTTLLST
jgi:hypothetical protein